jgi:hypothetical protein
LVAVTSFGFVAEADAHYRIKGRSHGCGYVIVTPHSDYGNSFGIRAKGVGCRLARTVVRSAEGWLCEHRVRQFGDRRSGIAHTDYRCRHPQHPRTKVVVWYRS